MKECSAEQAYPLNDAQRQRLALEALLGEPSPSWLVTGATIEGVTSLARFHDALLELFRVYPVLRTSFVTAGPRESWHQQIRGCDELWRGTPPVVQLPAGRSWIELLDVLEEGLESRNPDYRFSAAYCAGQDGCLRVAFAFDHMVFDLRSIDLVLAQLARGARGGDVHEHADSCRCGSNDFASFVKRTIDLADRPELPERYEWVHDLMLGASSPHAYARIPLARPLSVMDAGSAGGSQSTFVTDASRKHTYTPFAAFASALTLSLEVSFESPAIFYIPSLNRGPTEMESVGWFAGTPILPVRSGKIMPAVAGERILDGVHATSEAKAAATETVRDGHALTTLIHRKVGAALGGRLPFVDCLPDSLPYIVLGFADRVRQRTEWKADGIVVRKATLPATDFPPLLLPPGYIYLHLTHVTKAEWSIDTIYETERYEDGTIETLISGTERYLRQLL